MCRRSMMSTLVIFFLYVCVRVCVCVYMCVCLCVVIVIIVRLLCINGRGGVHPEGGRREGEG